MTTWEEFEKDLSDFNRQMDEKNERKLRETIARRQAELRAETGHPPATAAPAAPEIDLRDRYLKEYPHTCYGHAVGFRRCENGLWQPLSLTDLRAEIHRVAEHARGLHPSARLVGQVIELLRLSTATVDAQWQHEPQLIPFVNGVLDPFTLRFSPHQPQFYFTNAVLPYRYDPHAQCPVWLRFLQSRVPEAASFLAEFAGLCLTPAMQFESALWLHGPPGSGKSTFLHGLGLMLGPRAGPLSLADLQAARFDARELDGKTLLLAPEHADLDLNSVDRLNSFISGEDTAFQAPYGQRQHVRPMAKLACAFVRLPRLRDLASGLFRRVLIVPFPPLPPEQQDPSLKDQLTDEADGLFNWALGGLSDLLARGHFDPPPAVRAAALAFQQANDVPAEFLIECCERAPEKSAPAAPLYLAYHAWCLKNGYKPVARNKLALDWQRLGLQPVQIKGHNHWRGIGLNPYL
jgi:putative DNA primase/helicase